jgi:hypothetical protein
MTSANPLFITNGDGYKGLSVTSPAIDASSSNYPAILDISVIDDDASLLFDGSGKSRPATITLKDVGSDEFTLGATTNHPLAASEVGPSYLGGPSLSLRTNEKSDSHNTIAIFPNPAKNAITIETSKEIGDLVAVAIYNLNSQLVQKSSDFQKKNDTNQYDISDLNNGIYFVKVTSVGFSKTMKLIIQK